MDPSLDLERFQLAHIKREIIDLHDKEGTKLMEYLTSLEGAFERQRLEFQKREAELKATRRELKRKLEQSGKDLESKMALKEDKVTQIDMVYDKSSFHENIGFEKGRSTKKERDKIRELESKIEDLYEDLQMKEELVNCQRKQDERIKQKLEAEIDVLKKKATVGWILGLLSEVILHVEPGGVGYMMRMVRKVQKQLEAGKVSSQEAARTDCTYIQRQIQRLLNYCGKEDGAQKNGETQKRGKVCKKKAGGEQSSTLKSQQMKNARGDRMLALRPQKLKYKSSEPCHSITRGRAADSCFEESKCRREPSCFDFSRDDESCHSETDEKNEVPSLWAEVKLLDKDNLQQAVLNDHQAEMERMLETIETHLKYLIETEKTRKWQEAQARHLGYSPQESLPKSAVWKPNSLESYCSHWD